MYTRNYRIQKDCRADNQDTMENTFSENTPIKDETHASSAPAIDENACTVLDEPQKCEEITEHKKPKASAKRFKATRLPRLDNTAAQSSVLELPTRNQEEFMPPGDNENRCESESEVNFNLNECPCEKPIHKGERHFLSSLFRTCGSDVMLILALIVLLMLEGGDDILILALCFIIS